MPDKCCVPGCRGNYESEKDTVSVFKIPNEEPLRSIWLKSIPRKGWVPGKRAVVCEKHFHPACVSREIYANKDGIKTMISRKRPFLLPGAVPSLFLDMPKYLSVSSREDSAEQTNEKILESDDKNKCNTESSENISSEAELTFSQNSDLVVELEPQEMLQIKMEGEENNEYRTKNDIDHLNEYEEESEIASHFIPIVKYESEELDECEPDTIHVKQEDIPIKEDKIFINTNLNEESQLGTLSNTSPSGRCTSQVANTDIMTTVHIGKPADDHNRMSQYQESNEAVFKLTCEICNKLFSHRNELAEHLDIHERNCSFSNNSYIQDSDLSHKEELAFSCDLCGKSFINNITLNEHSCVLIGPHPFQKSFSKKSILNAQKRLKAIDRFVCNICNKLFFHKHHLIEHTMIHTGVCPFSCDICKQSFPRKRLLTIHKRAHKGETQFPLN